MGRRGGHLEVTLAAQNERENAIAGIEELAEVIATKLGARQSPPVIECIDIGIVADGVGDELLGNL